MNMNEVHNKLTFNIVSAPNKCYNIFMLEMIFSEISPHGLDVMF